MHTHLCNIIDSKGNSKCEKSCCQLLFNELNLKIQSEFRVSNINLTEYALQMRNNPIIFQTQGRVLKRFNEFQLLFLKSLPTINTDSSYHVTFSYLQKSHLNVQTAW